MFKKIPNTITLTKHKLHHHTMASSTIKTRILIVSDTHSTPLQTPTSNQTFRSPLPAADVLIHCGDLTMLGLIKEYDRTLDLLGKIDAKKKFVIAGNHDRTLDEEWMRTHQAHLPVAQRGLFEPARELWFGAEGRAVREGVTLLEEGVHEVELDNGASLTIYASQYQPEFYDWAFPYEKHQDRYNAPESSFTDAQNIAKNPIPSHEDKKIDIMMTHGPPFERGDQTAHGPVGCPHLLKALMRCRPLIHCFGHIHEGWGAEVVNWVEGATESASVPCSIQDWKDGEWERGVEKGKGVETVSYDAVKMNEERSVFVDVSKGGDREIQRGKQTLLVNAAIMDEHYKPVNAPFLVDLDLPRIET